MSTEAIAIVVTLALFGLTHTVILVRWGTRLQILVENHERSLYSDHGLHRWRHDVVTPRLIKLDEFFEEEKERGDRDA
jgi:hypothetical protein